MIGQHGKVWNLGGQFKIVDPIPDESVTTSVAETTPENEADDIEPFVVERDCRVPLGQEILIPVLNVECNTAEEVALGNLDPDATLEEKADYLLNECATVIADEVTETEASFGLLGSEPKDLKVQRIATKVPFQVTFSPDNILNPLFNELAEEVDFSNPDPNPSLAQADGYWVKVKPKKPGTYVLHTFGVAPAFDFALDITYTLEVAIEGPGALFEEASE